MLDTFSYERSEELRGKLLTKIFRLGPNVVQKNGTGNMVTMAFRGHQSNRKLFAIDFDKNDEYDDYSGLFWYLFLHKDIRSGVTLLIVFPIIIIFMIVLGYAAQSKRTSNMRRFKCFQSFLLIPCEIDTLKLFGLSKKICWEYLSYK